MEELASTGATPTNQPTAYNAALGGDDTSLVNDTSLEPPVSLLLSVTLNNDIQSVPAAPSLEACQKWDSFVSSPTTIAARSPPGEAPVEPISASVQPLVLGLQRLFPFCQQLLGRSRGVQPVFLSSTLPPTPLKVDILLQWRLPL